MGRPEPPRLLILDLMDTVVRDPFYTTVPGLLGVVNTEEVVELLAPEQWVAFETGAIDEGTYLRRMFRKPCPSGRSASEIRRAIVEAYRFVEGMDLLLHDVTASGRAEAIWALSNYSPWLQLLRQRLDLDRFFDGYVVSYLTGYRKPDPRAYEALLARAGYSARCCLFVDDRQCNVDAARGLGLPALAFRGAAELRTELRRWGLLD